MSLFIWIHGYLGSSKSFGSLPRTLVATFKPASNYFISYGFDQSFDDACAKVQAGIEDALNSTQSTNIIICAHSLGGILFAEAHRKSPLPGLVALCLFDVPFGGVRPTYVAEMGQTNVEDVITHIRQTYGVDVQAMENIVAMLEDFSDESEETKMARRESEIKKNPDLCFLLEGALKPLVHSFGSFLEPLLELHAALLRPIFDDKRLLESREYMERMHREKRIKCLHVHTESSEGKREACFEYLTLPDSSHWSNYAVQLADEVPSVFAPLTAHTSLFTRHSTAVFDECYLFICDYSSLQTRAQQSSCMRFVNLVTSPRVSIMILVVSVLLLFLHRYFDQTEQSK